MLLAFFDTQGVDSGSQAEPTWQEFEEQVRDVLEGAGFSTDFRRVFNAGGRRYEIDVVAQRFDTTVLIDAKRYSRSRVRNSAIRAQARKHLARSSEFEAAFSVKSVSVIVSWIDDDLLCEGGCFIVPFGKLPDFVRHLEYYVNSLPELDAFKSISDNTNEKGIF